MIKIRKGVFETNSSSTHCLVWHNTNKNDTTYVDFNAYVINAGYYGRAPKKPLICIEERLAYLWTAILCKARHLIDGWDSLDMDFVYKWQNKLKKYFPNTEFIIPQPIIHSYDTGEVFTWYDFDIDHAYDILHLVKQLDEDDTALRDFLFDTNGYILISGDEYDEDEEPFDPSLWPRLEDFGYSWHKLWDEGEHILKKDDTYVYYKGC